MASDEMDEHGSILMEGPSDPDAQATVTDFIDYTEYLPSDLVRSLTLIRGLDETYLNASAAVHELSKTYGSLPSLPPDSRPELAALRKQISEQLTRAINARESAYAESCRLYDAVDRHFDRLGCIKSKLDTLLRNFADDVATKSATTEAKQPADDRKARERASAPKITLRFDAARHQGGEVEDGDVQQQQQQQQQQKGRKKRGVSRAEQTRKSTPGVADSAVVSTETPGAEGEGATAALTTATTPKKAGTVKKGQKNRRQQPSASASGATAGGLDSSTSHALATLKPPPEDAQPGSEHMPWLRLTDWEMARLRKKMKKNNLWQPSEIMINRELAIRGRGWEGYRLAKANAELTGNEVPDCDDIANNYVPGKLVRKDETAGEVPEADRTKLSNRGMKLNEAKKQKRENLAREQAAMAAAEAEMAARRLGDIGSTFRSLFSSPAEQSPFNCVQNGSFGSSSPSNNADGITPKDRTKAKPSSKKRKLEETTAAMDDSQQQQQQQQRQDVETSTSGVTAPVTKPGSKRTKLSKGEVDGTGGMPLPAEPAAAATATSNAAPTTAGASLSKKPSPVSSAVGTKRTTRRSSMASAKAQPTPTPPRTTRSLSRRPSNAAPSDEAPGRELRKKSATPATARGSQPVHQPAVPPGPTTTTTRRTKRPAPGPVTVGQDGGASVSVGRRKAKPTPRKKKEPGQRGESQPLKEDIRIDEDGVLEEIDPNEPRYCICGDVSFGTMICCEDNDCDKEWFHIDCVGLSDVPSRTAKWYCPECRKKNNISAPDGIVRSTGRR